MLLPSQITPPRRWPAIAIAAAIVVIALSASVYIYAEIGASRRAHLVDRAATIARAVDPSDVGRLFASETDLSNPVYGELKSLLVDVRSVNRDARFVYVLGRTPSGDVFFYGDSEDPESEDYSPPGQEYAEASENTLAVFDDGQSRADGPETDRWGTWISGLAPVFDDAGRVVAVVGIDTPAGEQTRDALAYASLPLLMAALLLILLWASQHSREKEFNSLEQQAEFLSIAAHEIRTPMTGIRWAMESILSRTTLPLDAPAKTLLSLVYNNSLSLVNRIDNLLSVTALEHGSKAKATEIDARVVINDVVDALSLGAKQRDITLSPSDSLTIAPTLQGDRQALYHVFFNLVSNAIKYTKAGTTVTMSYELRGKEHAFMVSDQGDGITPEDQEHLFDGYYRAEQSSRQPGTGLGLYLSKKAIALHGGRIEVASTKGRGTTFTVFLPVR
jgi:signal transduction histidine kinase